MIGGLVVKGIFVERNIQGRRREESSGDEVEGINSWASNQDSSQKTSRLQSPLG